MIEKGDPCCCRTDKRYSEWIDEDRLESFQAAKERINEGNLQFTQTHASCDWLTPLEAEHRTGKLKYHWSRKAVIQKLYVNSYQDNIF